MGADSPVFHDGSTLCLVDCANPDRQLDYICNELKHKELGAPGRDFLD